MSLHIRCRAVRIFGSHFRVFVVGRNVVLAGTVDGSGFHTQNIVKYAALSEQLTYSRDYGREKHLYSSALPEAKLHCGGGAYSYSRVGFIDEFYEEFRETAYLYIADLKGASLGYGDDLFGNKDHIALFQILHNILIKKIVHNVFLHNDVGLDGKTSVGAPIRFDGKVFALVGLKRHFHCFSASPYFLLSFLIALITWSFLLTLLYHLRKI